VVTTIAGSAFNFGFVDDMNTDAEFNLTFGITVDRSNNVFVADYGNSHVSDGRMLEIDLNGGLLLA